MLPRNVWLMFAAAVATVLLAMGGVSWALLELEHERVVGERTAAREELVRLALWRIDSAATGMIAREVGEAGRQGGSPPPDGVRARFTVDVNGDVALLAIADGGDRVAIVDLIHTNAKELAPLEGARVSDGEGTIASEQLRDAVKNSNPIELSQNERNRWEYSKRQQSVENYLSWSLSPARQGSRPTDGVPASGETSVVDLMRPHWWSGQLVLARAVDTPRGRMIEGTLLDWPALRATLLAEVGDLLPRAQLEPAVPGAIADERQLATLPVRLEPGELEFPTLPMWRPMRLAVVGAWAFLLVAVAAVGLLLRASIGLAERRAAFVSAVTHELRTPLTTFRMYTEMLEGGMVEAKRAQYLATLRREAERLSALVENVLSFARIEADRGARERTRVSVGELVGRIAERLSRRCEAAGAELELELSDADAAADVEADIAATEQILFNLVDNAAKYGVGDDARVKLRVVVATQTVAIHVCDRGPGILPAERRMIFEPFAKGSAHVVGTKPGVGLGLALCRRLAREMNAELELVASDQGADFRLTLARQ